MSQQDAVGWPSWETDLHLISSKHDKEEEEEEVPVAENCLRYVPAVLSATILEDTLMQISILDECNNELRVIKTLSEEAARLRKKFGVLEPEVVDELESIDAQNLHCDQYKLDKLAADRSFCKKVLENTYSNLALENCYLPLVSTNADIQSLINYRAHLIEEEAKNKATRRDLAKQLRQQRNHIKTVTYDTDVLIETLRSQVEDAALVAEIRGRYIDNWQRARSEQHSQTIEDKEAGPSASVDYFTQRADHERRVHSEVETLTNICIEETLNTVEEWMKKYDEDMETIDLKIQLKKNAYHDILKKRLDMERLLTDHEELMKNWIKFKDDRQAALEYRDKMTSAAIVVQAWWRGLIVRLHLGPFKVKKKKKKDAKKKL